MNHYDNVTSIIQTHQRTHTHKYQELSCSSSWLLYSDWMWLTFFHVDKPLNQLLGALIFGTEFHPGHTKGFLGCRSFKVYFYKIVNVQGFFRAAKSCLKNESRKPVLARHLTKPNCFACWSYKEERAGSWRMTLPTLLGFLFICLLNIWPWLSHFIASLLILHMLSLC